GWRFLPLDLVFLEAELLRDILRDVDVESAHRAVRVLQSQAGLIELSPDDDRVATASTAAARGRGERQRDGESDRSHDALRKRWHVCPFRLVLKDLAEEV